MYKSLATVIGREIYGPLANLWRLRDKIRDACEEEGALICGTELGQTRSSVSVMLGNRTFLISITLLSA